VKASVVSRDSWNLKATVSPHRPVRSVDGVAAQNPIPGREQGWQAKTVA
jgi:hypothetical protein